jgi:hypothetical protein
MRYWRPLVRSKLAVVVLACVALILLACSKQASSTESVKYKSEADVPRINVQDAKAAVDKGEVILVDSRPEDAYKMEHLAGAINIPFGPHSEEKFSALPQGKKIIVYCS